jgi:uncharacterized protein (TIGR03083 family)
MSMPPDRAAFFLDCLRADSARLAEVARMGLAADVPSCPGWTVEDVVRHVSVVYLHKIEAIRRNARPEPWPPPDLADRDAFELYDEASARLMAELEQVGPDVPSWTFWPDDQTSGFWFRRMAQETAVHRVDAELAHEVVTPIDRSLALDGIDEVLRIMLGGPWWEEGDTRFPVDATVRVTSDGSSWTARLDATSAVITSTTTGTDAGSVTDAATATATATDAGTGAGIGTATGTGAVTPTATEGGADDDVAAEIFGEPDAMLLWLWGRRGTEAVQVAGDEATVEAFRGRMSECTT